MCAVIFKKPPRALCTDHIVMGILLANTHEKSKNFLDCNLLLYGAQRERWNFSQGIDLK